MLRQLSLLILLALAAPAWAGNATGPGSVAQVAVPEGYTHQYEPTADIHMLNYGSDDQVMVLAGIGMDPVAGMHLLLREFGATQYAGQVQALEYAGYEAASLQIVTQVHERWLVLAVDGASLVVRAASRTSHEAVAKALETVVRGAKMAPAVYPPLVVGSYNTNTSYSGSYDAGGPSVYAESGVRLLADGRIASSSHVGVSGDGVSGLSQGGEEGRWEVRGNRLLFGYQDGSVGNLRVQAFNNGLELWDQQGSKLLWVRN